MVLVDEDVKMDFEVLPTTQTPAAPSVKTDEFPAVKVPLPDFLSNTGFSTFNLSIEVLLRGIKSLLTSNNPSLWSIILLQFLFS